MNVVGARCLILIAIAHRKNYKELLEDMIVHKDRLAAWLAVSM